MTIPHQGIGRGRLVPSSNKGSKFRYTIVRQFSRGDERIREDIPIPDSLGKETFQVGIYTSSGKMMETLSDTSKILTTVYAHNNRALLFVQKSISSAGI